jgi:photosystem II PsbU protein
MLLSVTSGFVWGMQAAPKPSLARGTANPAFEDEVNFEPSQQARGEKIDINNAFVVSTESLVSLAV